jgi:raffinose/stachyose/melibiose transport system permease protein
MPGAAKAGCSQSPGQGKPEDRERAMTALTSQAGDGALSAGNPRRRRGIRRNRLTPWLFLIAPLILLGTFTYIPVVNLFYYSVTSWDGFDPHKTYVGLKNYRDFFNNSEYFHVFYVSLYYFAASFVQIGLALYFATVLSFKVKFANVFKGILFFPSLINGVAIGFVFLYFFREGGTLDSVLNLLGLAGFKHQWLGDPNLINYSLSGVSVWRYLGLNFVLFLGAIQSIPAQLYEAADIDGATRWQQFRYIIAPGIRPIIGLTFILAIAGSLAVFEIPFIMTGGANGSQTFVIQTVNQAFQRNHFGLASAMAVILLLIILLVTWIQRLILPDERANLT